MFMITFYHRCSRTSQPILENQCSLHDNEVPQEDPYLSTSRPQIVAAQIAREQENPCTLSKAPEQELSTIMRHVLVIQLAMKTRLLVLSKEEPHKTERVGTSLPQVQNALDEFMRQSKDVFARMSHLLPTGRSWVEPRNIHTHLLRTTSRFQ